MNSSLYVSLNLTFVVISYNILSGTYKHIIIVFKGGINLPGENASSRETSCLSGEIT